MLIKTNAIRNPNSKINKPYPKQTHVVLAKKVWERTQKNSHFKTASNSF